MSFPIVISLCTLRRVPWHLKQRVPPCVVSRWCPLPSMLTPGSPLLFSSLVTAVPVVWQLVSLVLRLVRHPWSHPVVPHLLNVGWAPVHRIMVVTRLDIWESLVLARRTLLVSARKCLAVVLAPVVKLLHLNSRRLPRHRSVVVTRPRPHIPV